MLTVENLEKRFVSHVLDGKQIVGFSPISFTVSNGTAMGLSGPSGYGKSSVLKCIYRTYLASSGRITYDSEIFGRIHLTELPENQILALRRREMGYVTQFLSVLPRVPVLDLVAEPLVNAGVDRSEARRAAGDLLQRLRIDARLHDAYPATFSGGEKQRVNLARAVIRPPRLLLLDEPTASLDAEAMGVVLELLVEMKQKGTTMIAIFHDRSIMDRLMDDIYHMPEKETHS
ncbi:phosphonate C-P lyase system protein PhnL [Desulfatitalea tepidiphila]|uniref:phosphonate C-P lyase system protein PhnL n=1 Tax=Desulfatitalea tepidiphila TaxID=1185843 RepID=UPI0006B444EF|nr:ATP-binding cassette domain-containing protein [Desulfatitalea tepidiphila]